MKWNGPDSIKSWLISLSCCFINSMMFGFARLSGVLFVASISRYKVGRQQASFPYTLASAIRNLSGPLVGYLGYKYGVRTITSLGALIGAFGVGLCCFAENIALVTVLWGIVFGLGFGLGNILLPIPINQYFKKHRATASGISFSGGCIGSFILPPLVEILLTNYGLSQTFLLLSALVLNCVPAALLLRKPNFKKQSENLHDKEQEEKQHTVSGLDSTFNMLEKNSNLPEKVRNCEYAKSVVSLNEKTSSQNCIILTEEEKMKRLSPQTLLSSYSVRMSASEPLDVEEIIGNVKEKRQLDFKILEGETLSLSSQNTNQDGTSEKDDVFENIPKFSSVDHEEHESCFQHYSDLSNNHILCTKHSDRQSETYENYNYQPDAGEIHDNSNFSNNIHMMDKTKDCTLQYPVNQNSISSYIQQQYYDILIHSPEEQRNLAHKIINHSKGNEWQYYKSENIVDKKSHLEKTKNASCLGSYSVLLDPIFVLITATDAIYTSSFVCMVTIIVDFSRDLHIEMHYEKYVLMLLSVGDIFGRLGLGWITDHGYMTTPTFAATCFACQGLFTAAIPWSSDFISLAVLVTLYGLAQAGLIVIYPIIISQYIDQDKQSIAIPSYHFLTGPTCLSLAPIIGYFRDEIGAYDWIFYGIGILSAVSSLFWIFASCMLKCRKRK